MDKVPLPVLRSTEMILEKPKYGAIAIDTSIFDGYGVALEAGYFRQLDQFKDGPFRVLQSEIVHKEVRAHLIAKTKEARGQVEKALRVARAHLAVAEDNINGARVLLEAGKDEDLADRRLAEFYERIGAEIVSSDGMVNLSRLVEMYFAPLPPFEPNSGKKNEFPDALALLALEAVAEKEGFRILAVSADKGWARFAESSDWIDVVDELPEALAEFQPHNVAARLIAEVRTVLQDPDSEIYRDVRQALVDSLDGADIYVEAHSSYACEDDDVYATYVGHEFSIEQDGAPEVTIIRYENESVVIQLSAEVECEVHASFGLSIWDSVDKEYIGMGSSTRSTIEKYDTDIIVTLSGDVAGGLQAVSIDEVEVTETISHADFGYVDPDWGYEE